MAFIEAPAPNWNFEYPDITITWIYPLELCSVTIQKWNGTAWVGYCGGGYGSGSSFNRGQWGNSELEITHDLDVAGWPDGDYRLQKVSAHYSSGNNIWYYYNAEINYCFTIGTPADPAPDKAINPIPTDAAVDVTYGTASFSWDAEEDVFSLFYFYIGDEWIYQGMTETTEWDISSLELQYAGVYYWRVDTLRDGRITTGDIWSLTIEPAPIPVQPDRDSEYDDDYVYRYDEVEGWGWYSNGNFLVTGGGRYKNRVVVVGHDCIYFGDV